MTQLIRLSIATLLLAVLNACAPVMAVPGPAHIDAPAVVKDERASILGPGDTLKLTVYGEDTLTGEYTIDPRGELTIPLAGQIKAAGLSPDDLQAEIADRLKASGMLVKPEVSVNVINMRPIYVVGQVAHAGSYPYQPGLTVLKAIALGGGYTPRAAQNMILIDRDTSKGRMRLNANENTPVLPGDSITVRERIF